MLFDKSDHKFKEFFLKSALFSESLLSIFWTVSFGAL